MNTQSPYTGPNLPPTPGQGLPPVASPVPEAVPAQRPEQLAPASLPLQPEAPEAPEAGIEQWLSRVEEGLAVANPAQRAAAVADVKARYQQEVLGRNVRTKAD